MVGRRRCLVVRGPPRHQRPETHPTLLATHPPTAQVTNGFDGAYNYTRMSKGIPMQDAAFSDVMDGSLVFNVFRGGARDAAKGDTCIGWFSVELSKLASGEKVRRTVVWRASSSRTEVMPPHPSPSPSPVRAGEGQL